MPPDDDEKSGNETNGDREAELEIEAELSDNLEPSVEENAKPERQRHHTGDDIDDDIPEIDEFVEWNEGNPECLMQHIILVVMYID